MAKRVLFIVIVALVTIASTATAGTTLLDTVRLLDAQVVVEDHVLPNYRTGGVIEHAFITQRNGRIGSKAKLAKVYRASVITKDAAEIFVMYDSGRKPAYHDVWMGDSRTQEYRPRNRGPFRTIRAGGDLGVANSAYTMRDVHLALERYRWIEKSVLPNGDIKLIGVDGPYEQVVLVITEALGTLVPVSLSTDGRTQTFGQFTMLPTGKVRPLHVTMRDERRGILTEQTIAWVTPVEVQRANPRFAQLVGAMLR